MEEKKMVPLHLKDLRTISGSLKNTISKSFGPNCQQTLLTSSTGQMSVTCSGFNVLSSLHVCHPVAKVMVDSLISFDHVYGDGCKTIAVYVDELFSAIESYFNKLNHGSSAETSLRVAVSRSLYEFVNSELLSICDDVRQFIYAQNCQEDIQGSQLFAQPLYYVILPCLQGLPGQVRHHLADILTTFVIKTAETGIDFNFVEKFLDNFLFLLPSHSYNNSHIRNGLFLQGRAFGQQFSSSPAKLIFLQCPLEGHVDKQATDTVKFNCDSAERFLTYRTHVATRTLQEFKNAGVSLILSAHKVPQFVLQMCHSLDLSVIACLSDTDTDLLMCLTGKFPVTSVYDGVHSENIVTVASWEHTVIGGKHFINLMFDESCTKYKPCTLFVCVPSENFRQQVKSYVTKSLTVANHCLQGSSKALNKTLSGTSSFPSGLNTEKTCSSLIPELEKCGVTNINTPVEVQYCKSRHPSVLNNILPASGYFEYVLTYVLKQFLEKNISPQSQMCCNFITKMMEVVPKMLHKNQPVSKPGRSCNFLRSQGDIMKAIDAAVVSGITTKKIFDYFHNDAVDVLNIKFEMTFSAINLVVKLLRIDCIVSVNRLIQEKHKYDMQPDNDDDDI